ncbi:MAG TPA: hypothetical protein VJZ27_08935 [Aggregatilineales bacterium]|nr:hypothetical protein [Aggregatilineales bacterium]
MADANTLVKQAVQAYKANDKTKARDLLLKAVDLDDRNEQAWMWMSLVAGSPEEQQICLDNVLALNPNNERAKKGLAVINQKLAQKGGSVSPKTSASPPAPSPAAPASNPLAGTGFDSNPFVGGWDTPGDGQPQIPTSVDWGNPAAPSAYGSGQQVNQPSPDQYDDWISNLGIGASESGGGASINPFTSMDWGTLPEAGDSAAPSSTAPVDDDPWGSLNTSADPWGSTPSTSAGSPSGSSFNSGGDPWGGVSTTPGAAPQSSASSDPWDSVTRSADNSNPFDSTESSDPWGSGSSAPSASNAWNSSSSSGNSEWSSPASESHDSDSWSSSGLGSDDNAGWSISSDSAAGSSGSSAQTSDAFSSSSYDDEEDDDTSYSSSSSAFGSSTFGVDADKDDSYSGGSAGTYTNFDFDEEFSVSADDFVFADDNTVQSFDFGGEDEFDPFSEDGFDFDTGTSPFPTRGGSAVSQYHQYIPAELRGSKGSNRGMMVMIFLLVILNIAGVVGLALA